MQEPWQAEYKRITDRKKRLEILEAERETSGDTPAFQVREKFFQGRYDRKDGQDLDYGIRGLMNLLIYNKRTILPLEKRRVQRELEKILSDLQFETAEAFGEDGAEALSDELFNTVLFYIELCESDRTYNSLILGLGQIKEETRTDKIFREIVDLSRFIPQKLHAEDRLSPLSKAAVEAFCFKYPQEAGRFA